MLTRKDQNTALAAEYTRSCLFATTIVVVFLLCILIYVR